MPSRHSVQNTPSISCVKAYIWIFLCLCCMLQGINVFRNAESKSTGRISDQMTPKKIIIDTDGGADDAFAIALAVLSPDTDILAITCVDGNTNIENVATNVHRVLEALNATHIPVYLGASKPLLDRGKKDFYFGKNGFGDVPLEFSGNRVHDEKENAISALTRLIKENPDEVTVLCIGPLTNIALASRVDSTFRRNIKRLVILGGSLCGYGNVEPGREFNFNCDPEAVHIVLNDTRKDISRVVIVPIDAELTTSILKDWRKLGMGMIDHKFIKMMNKVEHKFFTDMTTDFWLSFDTWATLVVLDTPNFVITKEKYNVEAIYTGQGRGGLLIDYMGLSNGYRNVEFVKKIDSDVYKSFIIDIFSEINN